MYAMCSVQYTQGTERRREEMHVLEHHSVNIKTVMEQPQTGRVWIRQDVTSARI